MTIATTRVPALPQRTHPPGTYSFGILAESAGSNGAGVGGVNSGSGYGTLGQSDSGYGLYGTSYSGTGVYGTTNGDIDAIVAVLTSNDHAGLAADNAGTGYGVWARAQGSGGIGVYGTAGAGGWGLYGDISGSYSTGVNGYSNGYAGIGLAGATDGDYSVAVAGNCIGNSCYGVYGTVLDCTGGTCYAVYANGNMYATGTYMGSDERYKKDIESLKGSLDKLLQLRGVSFYWKDPSLHGGNTGIQRGFIAQEYEKVFPEWVSTDKEGYLAISTTGLDSLEVESIRQLKNENDDLRKRIEALEAGRRPIVSSSAAWGWMAGLALAGAVVIGSRRKSKKDE